MHPPARLAPLAFGFLGLLSPVWASTAGEPDALRGYEFLINGNYIGCGIPLRAIERAGPFTDTAEPLLKLLAGGAADPVLFDPGISGRVGLNQRVSFKFNVFPSKRGVNVVSASCLSCHAGQIGHQTMRRPSSRD